MQSSTPIHAQRERTLCHLTVLRDDSIFTFRYQLCLFSLKSIDSVPESEIYLKNSASINIEKYRNNDSRSGAIHIFSH